MTEEERRKAYACNVVYDHLNWGSITADHLAVLANGIAGGAAKGQRSV
jgi:hypothetical protein